MRESQPLSRSKRLVRRQVPRCRSPSRLDQQVIVDQKIGGPHFGQGSDQERCPSAQRWRTSSPLVCSRSVRAQSVQSSSPIDCTRPIQNTRKSVQSPHLDGPFYCTPTHSKHYRVCPINPVHHGGYGEFRHNSLILLNILFTNYSNGELGEQKLVQGISMSGVLSAKTHSKPPSLKAFYTPGAYLLTGRGRLLVELSGAGCPP